MRPVITRAVTALAFAATLSVAALVSAQTPPPDKPAPQEKPAAGQKPPATAPDAAKPKPRFTAEDMGPPPAQDKPAAPAKPRFTAEDMQPDPQDKPAQKPRFSAADLEEGEPLPPLDPTKYSVAGWRACVRCHEKQSKAYVEGPHGVEWNARTPGADIGCETCHGPGQAHIDYPATKGLVLNVAKMTPRDASEKCLSCHKRGSHVLWQGSMHDARNVTCVNCHSVHHPESEQAHLKRASVVATCAQCHGDKAAKVQRSNHMPVREGKMDCSSCHDQHGSTNVRLLRAGQTVNESCTSCHAEKRGPFLWDHPPARENCATCHDPHGSSNDRVLVSKTTMLCQRCHIATRHPATPYDAVSLSNRVNRLVGRGCVNCHPMVHGSNHPSGQFLMR